MTGHGVVARLDKIRMEPAYRKVAATLTARITDGSLGLGERLPSELELARQLGVHRSTVREALRELESSGLLRRERGSKLMMVSRPDPEQVATGVSRALTLHHATVAEVWETLTIIGPPLAEIAARRRDPDALVALAAVVAAAEDPQTLRAAEQAVDFFRALAGATGNSVLSLTQEPLLQLVCSSLRRLIEVVPQSRSRIAVTQRLILSAIDSGDTVAARSWCDKHVRDYRRGFEIAGIDLSLPIPLDIE
jgi:GntR family transcriptional repressor for pyruvate dehydrogenase complex